MHDSFINLLSTHLVSFCFFQVDVQLNMTLPIHTYAVINSENFKEQMENMHDFFFQILLKFIVVHLMDSNDVYKM